MLKLISYLLIYKVFPNTLSYFVKTCLIKTFPKCFLADQQTEFLNIAHCRVATLLKRLTCNIITHTT